MSTDSQDKMTSPILGSQLYFQHLAYYLGPSPPSAVLDVGRADAENCTGSCLLVSVLTQGINKWLTDAPARGQRQASCNRANAWDTPEFPGQSRPGTTVSPKGLAHLEGCDVGEGDIDDQHARPALGGAHIAHLQRHGAFHVAGHQHARHGASCAQQAQPPTPAWDLWSFPASPAQSQGLQLPAGLALGQPSQSAMLRAGGASEVRENAAAAREPPGTPPRNGRRLCCQTVCTRRRPDPFLFLLLCRGWGVVS